MAGSEIVRFVGDVFCIDNKKRAEEFEERLREGVTTHGHFSGRTWRVRVIAYFLYEKELLRCARELGSKPYPGAAVVFLNPGAVHACKEFGLVHQPTSAPFRILPGWAVPTVDVSYRSQSPFGGPDPQ
jgi:hypothetical protein